MPAKLAAILWDLDGTLVDSEPLHEAAHVNAAAALRLSLPENFHKQLIGLSGAEVYARLTAEAGLKQTATEWANFKFQHYLAVLPELTLREGIAPLLETLAARNLPMGIVSNSTRDEVDANLKASGLADYFKITVSRNDVEHGKPDPQGYLQAAAALQFAPERCVVVEDSLPGTRAGLSAGMTTVYWPQNSDYLDQCPASAIALSPEQQLAPSLLALFD